MLVSTLFVLLYLYFINTLSEYDLNSLRVRKLGSGRKNFGTAIVRLDADVAEMFPTLMSRFILISTIQII